MHILRMNPSVWTCACRVFLVHSLHTVSCSCIWSHHKHTHTALGDIFSHRILAMAENSECVAHNFEENVVRLQEITESLCNPDSPGNPEPETWPIPAVGLPKHRLRDLSGGFLLN